MEKSNLKKAFDLLEDNGFHVSRAYEENNADVGKQELKEYPTGAIILRIEPKN
jgi:hypothetical protein